MKRIIVVFLLAALAGQAGATVGSIISSFHAGGPAPMIDNYVIYRDSTYVYQITKHSLATYFGTFTPSGEPVKGEELKPYGPRYGGFYDTGHCHLGESYFVTLSDEGLSPINTRTATMIEPIGFIEGNSVSWDGQYYYVYSDDYDAFCLYTPAGSFVRTWLPSGWPAGMVCYRAAFSRRANNASGRYLIVTTDSNVDYNYIFDMDTGSVVATWLKSFHNWGSAVCGDAAPSSYGASLWGLSYDWDTDVFTVYQTDIDARGATNVVPASVGKIKAIYR
jgi:hypothetical protein